jgi:anti-sigma B factor antagonist
MDDDDVTRPAVRLELLAPEIAVVTLSGEHDLSSKEELGTVLARAGAQRHLLVDLSACAFLDSTVLGLLVIACRRQWERGGGLELVIPGDAASIRRTMRIAGLTTFLTIHETREQALADLRAAG